MTLASGAFSATKCDHDHLKSAKPPRLVFKITKIYVKTWSIIYQNVNSFEMFLILHVMSRCIKSEVRCIQVSFYIKKMV